MFEEISGKEGKILKNMKSTRKRADPESINTDVFLSHVPFFQ